jgi:hypothetical protein
MERSRAAGDVRAFLLVCLELALIVLVLYRFAVEEQKHLLPVVCLAVGGFVVHAWLPRTMQPWFFTLLSLSGVLFVLGWPNGAWVIGIGGGLIAVALLPVPILFRVLLVVVAGVQLASLRMQFPAPFWPILGSMFMFRLIVYLYETRHGGSRPPLAHTLAYFFPLPNVSFTLFPVLDFKTFRDTYYNAADYEVYQTGVAWMVRGISHLLLYRVVKYFLLPAPYELRDWAHLALFLAANYALYLRVSGWFHLITGMLHLFGFNLPRTHDCYFLASSFSDVWRRINIYWKEFMAKVFFFPAFFSLRPWGTRLALAGAVLWVFLATWLLHSYQMFWLTGGLPLSWNDAVLWMAVGVLVAVNLQGDVGRARAAPSPPIPLPQTGGEGRAAGTRPLGEDLRAAATLSLRRVGMFGLVSFFWACWTIPGFVRYLRVPSVSAVGLAQVLAGVTAVAAAAMTIGVLITWVRGRMFRRGVLPIPLTFSRSAALQLGALGLLLAAGSPEWISWFSPSAGEVMATLRLESHTPVEAGQLAQNYYETIAETNVPSGAFLGSLAGKEMPQEHGAEYSAMTRPAADPLLERELIPGWHGELAGSPLTINKLGMRDREGITPHKPANTCRIALVGSSIVLGYGVADDQVFKVLVEERLNVTGRIHYELLNFGTGLSTVIQRRALVDQKVFAFEPDVLFYFAHQDELLSPGRDLAHLVAQGVSLPYPCLNDVVRTAGVRSGMSSGTTESLLLRKGPDIVRCLYPDLDAACRRRGVLPVWIYLPMPGVVEVSARSAAVVNLATEAGFTVVNLAGWSDGHAPGEIMLSPTDHHPNALGHRLIAERLSEVIRKQPELLPAFARLKP